MRADAVRRALRTEVDAARVRRNGAPVRVLDVGGGSGGWAVPLAAQGCSVTVIEPSPDALATLQRRAKDAGVGELVTAVQGDTEALGELAADGQAELVLAHGLLEVVDDVPAALSALRAAAAPGGAVSVVVANKYAAVLHRVLAGHPVEAHRLLDDADGAPAGDGDTVPGASAPAGSPVGRRASPASSGSSAGRRASSALLRRFDVERLRAALSAAGLDVEVLQGYGAVADLAPPDLGDDPGTAEALAQLEVVAANTPALREIASLLHAVARRS